MTTDTSGFPSGATSDNYGVDGQQQIPYVWMFDEKVDIQLG